MAARGLPFAFLTLLVGCFLPSASFMAPSTGVPALHTQLLRSERCIQPRLSPLVAADISPLEDEGSYHALLEQAVCQDRYVVIKFYASWCRACKAMAPKYRRLADDFPHIEFHEILFENRRQILP